MADIDITNYTDYRSFLSDYIAVKKAESRSFTIRKFCMRAGISTDNYLLRVLRKQRNLGHRTTERFIATLPLKGVDAQYFRTLVYLDSAKSTDEKNRYLSEVESFRRKRKKTVSGIIDNSAMRHWYTIAVWELASCYQFKLTPQSTVNALKKKISLSQAQEAIQFLKDKGYLVQKNGRLEQMGSPILSTDGVADAIVRINHKQTVEAALKAIDLPLNERGFYGLTLAINQKRLPELKQRLKKCIEEIQSEFCLDPHADTVYRINTHCFPLT